MNKTRFSTFFGVLVLSLALVGMALAADNTEKPPPQQQVAFTGTADSNINSLSGSYVVFDPNAGGDTCYAPGMSQTFCFRAESWTNDWEYVYNLWEKFPTDWTVTNVYVAGTPVCDGGGTWGDLTWTFETSPYEVNLTHNRYQATTDHCVATYCFEVVSGSGAPDALESWYWDGDGYNAAPHHPCSVDNYTPASMADYPCDEAINPQASIPPCSFDPGVYLLPPEMEASGCNGVPQVHTFSLFNNTGTAGTFDMTYTAPAGMANISGPAQVYADNGATVPIDVLLEPYVCNFEDIVSTIEAAGNGYYDISTLTKHIIDIPGWEAVPNSAPTWAGVGYPRDGCTAMNAAGEWVTYELGDTSGIFGFWGYNLDTNLWFQVGAANTPADRWAPDWAYDPTTNLCYVTGGGNTPGGGTYNDAYVFDPVANSFTQLGSFTSMRDFHNSWVGTIDGTKYLCIGGGVNSSSILVPATQCYDLAQAAPGVWNAENAQMSAFPTDPFGAADGILHAPTGDQFWYVGGAINNFATVTDEVRYWDDADNSWHFAGNTGVPRYRVEGDFFNGEFFQLGGSSAGFTPTSDALRGTFDGTNWVWALLPNLANGRMDNLVGVTDDSVWSIDGYGANASSYVERLAFCPLCTGGLDIDKTATPVVLEGDPIDYSITIENTDITPNYGVMFDWIPAGTTYVPDSVTCTTGDCYWDPANAIVWYGELAGAVAPPGGAGVDSLTGSYVVFDPSLAGDVCYEPSTPQTLCYRAESFSPDYAYAYNIWMKFPVDWTVDNAYLVGTPWCSNGSWGDFSWSFETSPYEINIYHPRYMGSGGAHCIATYCVDVTSGPSGSSTSWYWAGDDYGGPPKHPCSSDQYTPASQTDACDEWVNPLATVPPCSLPSTVRSTSRSWQIRCLARHPLTILLRCIGERLAMQRLKQAPMLCAQRGLISKLHRLSLIQSKRQTQ